MRTRFNACITGLLASGNGNESLPKTKTLIITLGALFFPLLLFLTHLNLIINRFWQRYDLLNINQTRIPILIWL